MRSSDRLSGNNRLIFAVFVMLSTAFPGRSSCAEEYIHAQAAIAVKTAVSGGRYTIFQVAESARKSGIDVVITSEAFLNKWQYGLWPLRNVIRMTVETRSLLKYGIRRYLNELKVAQEGYRKPLIIGGVEAAPFYYWKGSPFRGDLAIKDWHKHLLVTGLKTAKDYTGLPVIGNCAALAGPAGFKSLLYVFSLLLILFAGLFGILLMHWRYYGFALALAGALLLMNAYPFTGVKYDQYHGDRGYMPYQNLIDYVNGRGGMAFWVHLEAKNVERVGNVSVTTPEHSDLIEMTTGYTGFAVFEEGYNIVGRPDGLWDAALREYCRGDRRSPVWAIGALNYEAGGDLGGSMDRLRTVLLIGKLTVDEALDALRAGRAYAVAGSDASRFRLDNFTVGDSSGSAPAVMGQEALVRGAPRIRMSGRFTDPGAKPVPVKILLLKDGRPLNFFETETPFDITYDDEHAEEAGRHYYRAELRAKDLMLITNPVFVMRSAK